MLWRKIRRGKQMNESHAADFVIIGAGAAGLSAAAYAARAGLSVKVLEQMGPGGQALVIDHIENYPGFGGGISGFELAQRFENQATGFGAQIEYAEVDSIMKSEQGFIIKASNGEYSAKAVLLATGAVHRSLDVPGEERYRGKGVSYCATCDGPFFRGKRILVVGGGDSAVQETLYLANLSDKITIIHRRDRFRAQAGIVKRLMSNPNVTARLSTIIKEIKGDGAKVTSAVLENVETGEISEEEFDAVFGFVGIIPQNKLAIQLGAKLDNAGYIITDAGMSTSIEGVFAAGDVRNTPFRQIVTGCSDGAIAAHMAQEYIENLSGNAYPGKRS